VVQIINANPPFLHESNHETLCNESLADDSTILSIIDKDSFSAIKNILSDFANISGLECNYDKTVLLAINQLTPDENIVVQDSGFKVVDSIKLLGANITANYSDLERNFEPIINKIISLISFWSRFCLTLPGRISIAKTYLLSQINYLGCIFSPGEVQLNTMQSIINNYVKGGLQISEERIYLSPAEGGLGFFNIKKFLGAQRCTWLFRAIKAPIDNWRYNLHFLAPMNDPFLIRKRDVPVDLYPTLHRIVGDYEDFYYYFCKYNNNFTKSQIFDNGIFRDTAAGTLLDNNFFGRRFFNENSAAIRKLTYQDCVINNEFKSIADFRDINLDLSVALWLRLRGSILRAKNTFFIENSIGNRPECISDFVSRWKRGCKKVRNFFSSSVDPLSSRSFLKFCELTGVNPDPGETVFGAWFKNWNISSLSNDFRSFIFKLRYNYLPTNNRLNSFIPSVDPRCTYCMLNDANTGQRDSLNHCFFECKSINTYLVKIFELTRFEEMGDINSHESKILYWYGIYKKNTLTTSRHLMFLLFFDSVKYVFFKNRKRRINSSCDQFLEELRYFLQSIFLANKSLKECFLVHMSSRIFSRRGVNFFLLFDMPDLSVSSENPI
jgi:hypothetical protein